MENFKNLDFAVCLKQKLEEIFDIEIDKDLINFNTYKIGFNFPMFNPYGVDMNPYLENVIITEILNSIDKLITKSFTKEVDVLDLRNQEPNSLKNFLDSIHGNNIIIGSELSVLFSDNLQLNTDNNISTDIYSRIGKLNKLFKTKVLNNRYISPNDTKVLSYDKIKINFIFDKIVEVVDEYTLIPKFLIEYKIDYNIISPYIYYVITDNTSSEILNKANSFLTRKNREEIINKIL